MQLKLQAVNFESFNYYSDEDLEMRIYNYMFSKVLIRSVWFFKESLDFIQDLKNLKSFYDMMDGNSGLSVGTIL